MSLSEDQLKTIAGLSESQAKLRLEQEGYNELPTDKNRGFFHLVLDVFKEPMFLLLVACGLVYLLLGDFEEACMLLGFVLLIIGITVYQEGKAEKALDALRNLSSPRALVIRDGQQKRIPGREVVREDIMILREGDRVAADAVLLWEMNLSANESVLTGESCAVRKIAGESVDIKTCRPGGDDLPFLYSGSLIVGGQGVARVLATGVHTEMGHIGKMLETVEQEPTTLQKETALLVKKIFIAALILCVAVVVTYGLTRHKWFEAILSGISLAMAMLPEEFPVVLTLFMALGAWRMSKKSVLARKSAAIETLGATTVLCVDKTGTLTENKMAVRKIFNGKNTMMISSSSGEPLPEEFHELIEYGILASKKDPFDPMEKAFESLGKQKLKNTEHLHEEWPLIKEYPLSKGLLALSHVWDVPNNGGYVISAKGAPEAIMDLCHLGQLEQQNLSRTIDQMASRGLRVLGVAKAFFDKEHLPSSQHDFNFTFVGFIGLEDPIRPTVPAAIQECFQAGMRVIMITGDYPGTAKNIAGQIGLPNPESFIAGPDLQAMSQTELTEKIKQVNIFCRVMPEQKLGIVNALKSCGEIVGMTGDGVNDAPALRSAHIGVAMGQRGTDVARESSALVVLNDDFGSIVEAVRMGRCIFDNLRKAMSYVISVHIPIAGMTFLPLLFGWPIVLFPAHIVFLELIIDPTCTLVFESEKPENNVMRRPPRNPREPLFTRRLFGISILQGLFSLIMVLLVFKISTAWGNTETEARTLAFLTLVTSNICLILTNRSWNKSILWNLLGMNRVLLVVLVAVASLLGLIFSVPVLTRLFHFGPISCLDILCCIAAGIASILWFELVKIISRKTGFQLMR
jgi:Ca2+-transporting ATPase